MNAPDLHDDNHEVEARILDVLTDEDGDLLLGQALTVLLHVVAGICCQAQDPAELVTEFAVKVRRQVASAQAANRKKMLQ